MAPATTEVLSDDRSWQNLIVTSARSRPTFADWLEGARLRTLPAAIAPVLAGTGTAGADARFGRAVLAAIVALTLQIGVNFANDYSDGIRGTDEHRVGPVRLTASGVVAPRTVKRIAFAWFALAAVAGLALVVISGAWWLLAAGAAAIVAAWFYTGGQNPYGYLGLGEVVVFIFFGLMATWGTTYTQTLSLDGSTIIAGISMGLIACALLMINNIRDIPTDTVADKRTLAVRIGERRARWVYGAFMVLGVLLAFGAGLTMLPTSSPLVTTVISAGTFGLGIWAGMLSARVVLGTASMIPTLRDTGLVQLGLGLALLLVGIIL